MLSRPCVRPRCRTRLSSRLSTTRRSRRCGLRCWILGQGSRRNFRPAFLSRFLRQPQSGANPGHGARFVVALPVAVEPSPEPPVPEPLPATVVTGKAILVIDDEVATAKALVRLFHRDG